MNTDWAFKIGNGVCLIGAGAEVEVVDVVGDLVDIKCGEDVSVIHKDDLTLLRTNII